jgi:hypothetical protein
MDCLKFQSQVYFAYITSLGPLAKRQDPAIQASSENLGRTRYYRQGHLRLCSLYLNLEVWPRLCIPCPHEETRGHENKDSSVYLRIQVTAPCTIDDGACNLWGL